jgi:hypothetical protein
LLSGFCPVGAASVVPYEKSWYPTFCAAELVQATNRPVTKTAITASFARDGICTRLSRKLKIFSPKLPSARLWLHLGWA